MCCESDKVVCVFHTACEVYWLFVAACSYAESASRLLYQVYCELVLPIPPELEHLRTPDSCANEHSVSPSSSVDAVMSYQSSSAGVGDTKTTRDRPR